MAFASFVNWGTNGSSTGSASPVIPASLTDGDLMVLCVQTANEAVTAPAGWLEAPSSPQSIGTAGAVGSVRLTVFYKYFATGETAPTIADAGDHVISQIFGFTGAAATNVFNASSGDTAASSTSITCPAATTTETDCLILNIVGHARDAFGFANFSAWANASLASVAEIGDLAASTGHGGGFGLATGQLATPGSSGNTTATLAAASAQARITLAIRSTTSVAPTREGVLAKTLANATLASTGKLAIAGALGVTLANLSLSSAGQLQISGALSATLANAALSSAGILPLTGAVNATLSNVILSSVLERDEGGRVDAVLANATLAATGKLAISGVASATLAPASLVATGTLPLVGVLSTTLASASLSAQGQQIIETIGTVSVTLNDVALQTAGVLPISGALAKTLANITLDAFGAAERVGTLSVTLQNLNLQSIIGLTSQTKRRVVMVIRY